MPTAEQIPVGNEKDSDFSSLVHFGLFDKQNNAHQVILDAQCTFANTLSAHKAIELSPDGSHGRALEDIVVYSFNGEHTPGGESLSEGQKIYEIPMGDHIEIYRFVQPEELNYISRIDEIVHETLKNHLFHEKSGLDGARTYTHPDVGTITVTMPKGDVPRAAVVSKVIQGGLTLFELDIADKTLRMYFDEHHIPIKTTITDRTGNAARIYGAEAVINGQGVWVREPSAMHTTYKQEFLVVYNPLIDDEEAALVRIKEPNLLNLTNAPEQKPYMSNILEILTGQGWHFGDPDGNLHVLQLHTPKNNLPIYMVYQGNQGQSDEHTQAILASVAHDFHHVPHGGGIEYNAATIQGFIHLKGSPGIQMINEHTIQINLYDNHFNKASLLDLEAR